MTGSSEDVQWKLIKEWLASTSCAVKGSAGGKGVGCC